MPANKGEKEESDTKEQQLDVITHKNCDFDKIYTGLKIRMSPKTSTLNFF